jgi:hypothetical protein
MKLLELMTEDQKVISIVGMAKNAGKTEVLNQLIDESILTGQTIGLTSIGRDGESEDVVTMTEKPLIYIVKGTIIATLEHFILNSDIEIDILEITEFSSSMGRIVIGRAVQDGTIQIAGPSTNKGIKYVCDRMLSFGAERILVDGALSRVSSAAPGITDGTILATGAVLSRDLKKAVEKTVHQVHLFSLAQVKDQMIYEKANALIENNTVALIDDQGNTTRLAIKTALNAGRTIANAIDDTIQYIVFPGSLVSKIIKDVYDSGKHKNVTFIVHDATKIFINERDLKFFNKVGITIEVLTQVNLLALTINPYSPSGYSFATDEFRNRLKSYIKDLPIIDVLESR